MNGKTLFLALLALTVLRAALVSFADIAPDEAYYALCAVRPAPAYFDGPPGAMALASLGEIARSLPDAVWRWWAPVWAALASAACYLLVRALDGPVRAGWTTLILNALPVFNACAVRVRPELPALALVLLALWLVWRALHSGEAALIHWLGAAVCSAVAVQFSYAALWIVPGVMLHTLCSVRHRRWTDAAGLSLMLVLPAVTLLPALVWNARLEWVPIFPGTFRSLWEFSVGGFLASVARLMDKFSPLLPAVLVAAWVAAVRRARLHVRSRFVALCVLPAVILTGFHALRDADPVFSFLLATPLLIFQALVWLSETRWGRPLLGASVILAVGFSALSVTRSWSEGTGWGRAADALREAYATATGQGHEGVFLVAGDAPLAAIMGYHLRDVLVPPEGHPAVYERESQDISSQFGLWPGYDDFVETDRVVDEYFTEQKGENPFVGRSALYLSREAPDELPQTIKAGFESVTFLEQLPPAGGDGAPLYLYFCLNYQTVPL